MDKEIKLNLGCGEDHRGEGWQNLDKMPGRADVVCDLEDACLPYKDNTVTFVLVSHVLEHIKNYVALMKEIHRVMKSKGVILIKVPEFPCGASVADPTHVRFFVPESFVYFTAKYLGYDTAGCSGLFNLLWIESEKHNRKEIDRGTLGRYFTELTVEMEARK